MFDVKDLQKMDFGKLKENLTKLRKEYESAWANFWDANEEGNPEAMSSTYRQVMITQHRWQNCESACIWAEHIRYCHSDGSEHKDGCGGY